MLKKITGISVSLILILLVGCGHENGEKKSGFEIPAIIDVQIITDSAHPNIGEEVRIDAVVTQAGEAVEDATDMSFEVWESRSDDHEMIVGEYVGEGVYSITKTFDEDGMYNIVAHVTAREQHTMPRIELIVGTFGDQEHSHDDIHGDIHAEENITIEIILPDPLVPKKKLEIKTVVIHQETPLTGASVKFEIWKNTGSKHEYLNAEEILEGEYSSTVEFDQSGLYHLVVHVQNESLHEHIEKQIEVVEKVEK